MEEEAAGRRAWSEEARANRKRAADFRSTELWRNEQDRINKLNPNIPAHKKESYLATCLCELSTPFPQKDMRATLLN